MKFDATTTQILKNFSSINPSIQFKKGNRLATISSNKTVLARASLSQEIPADFAIYDLPRFLESILLFGALSLISRTSIWRFLKVVPSSTTRSPMHH